jgi:hypothetical protein
MRKHLVLAAVLAIPVLLIARLAAQVQPMPGPGTGVVTVTGKVDVGQAPPLRAMQEGEWRMAVTSAPPLVQAPLGIVRPRASYLVTWTTSESDLIAVEEIGPGAWVRGNVGNQAVWLNLAAARSVREAR